MFGKLSRSRWLLLLMCLILFIVMSIFYQMEDEGGKIRRQEISGHATNQTFLHIDHAQSMLVSLQFRYLSLIKLLSTQPSCLNVQLTSVVHLCGLYLRVVQKIRKSKSFVDKYFSSGRRAIRTVSGLKQRFIKFQSNLIEHN